MKADSITDADIAGARLATDHPIDHEHSRITFIGDHIAVPTPHDR